MKVDDNVNHLVFCSQIGRVIKSLQHCKQFNVDVQSTILTTSLHVDPQSAMSDVSLNVDNLTQLLVPMPTSLPLKESLVEENKMIGS